MDFTSKKGRKRDRKDKGRTEQRKGAGKLKYKKICNIAVSSFVCLDFVTISLILRFMLLIKYQDLENKDMSVADSNCCVHVACVFRTLKHRKCLEISKRKILCVLEFPVEL
jgi:hypothetical protein